MKYESVIGLEIHSQLLTKSKMFCSCNSNYQNAPPNSMICEICMGMPGVMPVANRRAIELVIATGLALDCKIADETKFDRKNYPYPDLMKGYQISQYDKPVAINGHISISDEGKEKIIGITRVHLEEDVAKLQHVDDSSGQYSLLDINRSGVPLMEIVSEPDMRSPEEARLYLSEIHSILRYIEASAANMEEGSFRCDANISIRPIGTEKLGTKVEIKNMNSFRAVYTALTYEKQRQIQLIEEDGEIKQETRGWLDDKEITVSQRSKEQASDYRYFPEPDLPMITINTAWVNTIEQTLPELPQKRAERFTNSYNLSLDDAKSLTISKQKADFFESVIKEKEQIGIVTKELAKSICNWVLGEMTRLLNNSSTNIENTKISPSQLMDLIQLVETGRLSTGMARTVFEKMFVSGESPTAISDKLGLVQISDTSIVEKAVSEVIDNNSKPVADFLNGKDTALKFLVGQVMKKTKGNANPKIVGEILTEKLNSLKNISG